MILPRIRLPRTMDLDNWDAEATFRVISAQTLKNTQALTVPTVFLPLLQKAKEFLALRTQTPQHLPVIHSRLRARTVYELASVSIRTVPLILVPVAIPGFVLRGKEVLDSSLFISVREVTLPRPIGTLSAKGHSIPFTQYLQTWILRHLPMSWTLSENRCRYFPCGNSPSPTALIDSEGPEEDRN